MPANVFTIFLFIFYNINRLNGLAESQGRRIFLIEAVKQKNIDVVNWLINEEADLNIRDGDQRTPLMHAVSNENELELVKHLVDKGANIFLSDKNGTTALHLAATAGQIDIIEYFQTQDIFLGVKDSQERSSLLLAAAFGQTSTLSYLISQGENPYSYDIDGLTSVHLAAKNGHINVLKELNNRSIDLDIKTKDEVTPLILAALNNHTIAATYLVDCGANINTLSVRYGSPLHAASHSGNFDLVKLFIEYNASATLNSFGQSPIYVASKNGYLHIVKYLMQHGADPRIVDKEGNHLMHSAAASGNVELIKFLVSKQLSPEIKNNKGESPLLVAAERGHLNIAKHLVNMGCDVNSVNNLIFSVMHAATVSGNLHLCEYLSDNGAVVNSKDFYGMTPLHYASKHGKLSVLVFIIEKMLVDQMKIDSRKIPKNIYRSLESCISCYKIVVNAKDNRGRTPIFIAAENGHENVLKILIEHGGNFTMTNNTGISPFHIAASNGHVNCLKILAFYIADLDIKNLGKTALILSAESNKLDSVIFLNEAGANPLLAGNNGMTAMHAASSNGNLQIVMYLARFSDLIIAKDNLNRTPAWYASYGGHIECLSYLINLDTKIKFQILESSIEGEQLKSLELLLRNGADIKATNSKGLSLLDLACEKGNISFVEFLMDNDPNFEINTSYSLNGLRTAVINKKYGIVNLFISRGVDICTINNLDSNLKNISPLVDLNLLKLFLHKGCTKFVKTALKFAAEKDMPEVIQFLVDHRQNINQTFYHGKTLLHIAVESSDGTLSPTVELLLKLKVNLNLKDDFGNFPIHYAVKKTNIEVLKALINAGANLNEKNVEGKSPLDIATDSENWITVSVLKSYGAIGFHTTTSEDNSREEGFPFYHSINRNYNY